MQVRLEDDTTSRDVGGVEEHLGDLSPGVPTISRLHDGQGRDASSPAEAAGSEGT